MTIDDVLPTWDWRSAHNAQVAASPERAAAAAREFSGRDLPVTGALMRVRMLGRHRSDDRPIRRGDGEDRPGHARSTSRRDVVLGGVLSPWRLRGGHRRVASADELRAFAEPGWVRAATAFTVTPEGAGSPGAHRDADRRHRRHGAPALRALLAPDRPLQLDHAPRDARRHPSQGRGMRGYLGLGSNVGDRRANLQAAVDALPAHGVIVLACSSTYDTDPVGEILDQPSFLNACARIETALAPEELLDACKAIERELGRDLESGVRHAPRPIDVDLLLLGDEPYAIRAPDAAPRAGHAAALRAHPAARARLRPAGPPTARG